MSKWTFVFVFVWCIQVHAGVYAQNKNPIRLSLKEVGLKDVLWEIEKQTAFIFMYNAEDLDQMGKLDISITTDKVEDILKKCLEGSSLTYSIQDAVIVLKPLQQAQTPKEIRIKGKVTDVRKTPLPGTTVIVSIDKGGRPVLGTSTDQEGRYQLNIPAEIKDFVLYFSFIGMKPQQVKYTGQETVNVVMMEEKKEIEEVVVTGYANIKKSSFTGNATTVTKDQLLQTNNKNVISALQTFDPSFRIKENTLWGSDPNALPEINIRGESSIAMRKGLDVEAERRTQRTNLKDNPNMPIFILDGFEVPVEKIYDMDINRIESMTILKDAAATAMYGSRAANGVVVVTSVAPKPGELQVTYNFTGGAEFPDLRDYNLCNAEEKLEVERLAGLFVSSTPSGQADKDIEYNQKLENVLRGINSDWMAQPLRNVFNHTHSLNLQGGVESIRYSLDLNHDSNRGVMKGSHRTRTGAGLTLDYRSKKWLQLMNQVTYNTNRTEDSPYGSFGDYVVLQPYDPMYDENGEFTKELKYSNTTNPLWKVANLQSFAGKGKSEDITDNLSVNLYLLDGLQVKGQFSITKNTSKTETFADPADPIYSSTTNSAEKGSLSRSLTDNYSWNVNTMIYYNKSIARHFINATLGMNAQTSKSESTSMTFYGFQLGNMATSAFASQQPDKTNITTSENRLIGFLGSVNYSYNDVYLFDGSFRFDASSQFGKDKRWAPFWSVGGGINFHNYEFLKDNWVMNTLKIRASYGNTGKVNFPAYTAITTYQMDNDAWYFTGPAAGLMALGNPKLTWETTKTVDAGITLGMFRDLIYISASYYHKKTDDLIDAVAVRSASGFKEYNVNMGAVLNEGYEINLNATLYRGKDWMVTVNANLAHNRNEIVELGAEMNAYNQKLLEEFNKYTDPSKEDFSGPMGIPTGHNSEYEGLVSTPLIQYYKGASTTAIYAVRSAGIDPANGRELFIKKNGQTTYTWCADDQVVVGDRNPDAQGSFGLNVGYKGIYLNASFMYQWGAQSYNETLLDRVENARIRYQNVDKRVLTQRWKQAGDIVPYYDLNLNNSKTAAHINRPTSRFVQDYNYLNFSSLSIGYDFKRELISKWKLRTLGIRFNAHDICRWSSIKEERGTSYPFSRTYNFTLTLGI